MRVDYEKKDEKYWNPAVWFGGFEVTVDDLGTVSYTNAQGYTRDYKLYKTGKASLGAISAEIK